MKEQTNEINSLTQSTMNFSESKNNEQTKWLTNDL